MTASAGLNPPRNGEVARSVGGASSRALKPTTLLARRLRQEMSLAEVLLWQQLRGQQLGVKFRKGHGIGPYVVDFYCCSLRLAVEVDGRAHERGKQPAYDAERDAFIRQNGHKVLRISAVEVLRNLSSVIELISLRVATPLRRFAPPPRAGED